MMGAIKILCDHNIYKSVFAASPIFTDRHDTYMTKLPTLHYITKRDEVKYVQNKIYDLEWSFKHKYLRAVSQIGSLLFMVNMPRKRNKNLINWYFSCRTYISS